MAADICDAYPDVVPAAKLKSLEIDLQAALPARYARYLAKVSIVNGEPGKGAAPLPQKRNTTGDTSRYRIVIPRGFQRLNCQLIDLARDIATKRTPPVQHLREEFDRCATDMEDVYACFSRWISGQARSRNAQYDPKDKGWQAYATDLHDAQDASLKYILAHEGGHIIYERAIADGTADGSVDTETSADLVAALTLVSQDEAVRPAIQTLSMLSFVDRHLDWTKDPHPPYGCRARLIANIDARVAKLASSLQDWAEAGGISEPAAVTEASDPIDFLDQRTCPTATASIVDTARQDVVRLADAARAATKLKGYSIRVVDTLLGVRSTSSFGIALRGEIISSLSTVQLRNIANEMNNRLMDGDRAGARTFGGVIVAMTSRMEGLYKSGLISARDQAHFRFFLKYLSMAASFDIVPEELEPLIADVQKYDPASAELPYYKAFLEIARGRCKTASAYLQKADKLDPDSHYLRDFPIDLDSISSDDCAHLVHRGIGF